MDIPSPPRVPRSARLLWLGAGGILAIAVALAAAFFLGRASGPVPSELGDQAGGPDRGGKRPADPPPEAPGLVGFDDWLQDVEAAKKRAAAEGKDLLLAFLGPDGFSLRLAYEVLQQREFRARTDGQFIPVLIDFPRDPAAKARVQDAQRNAQAKRQFRVKRLPRVMAADAGGFPYAVEDYVEGGVEGFFKQLARGQARRSQRDRLFREIEVAGGEAKLAAIQQALLLLNEWKLTSFYGPVVDDWLDAARQLDPENEKGVHEVVFETAWLLSLAQMETDEPDPQEVSRKIAGLDEWIASHRIRDPDRAASLHLYAAGLLAASRRQAEAMKHVEAGLACQPKGPLLREQLLSAAASIRGAGTGTGFAVAPDGMVLTNFHVVEGPGKILVQWQGRDAPCPAVLVAHDAQRDIALLKVALPAGTGLAPVPLAADPAKRGSRVLAIGFPPATHAADPALKLTQGIVSATPEENADRMLVLDCRVNPGNSGGPLCDVFGNAVGMVTAKTAGGSGVESYGMALPADVLRTFLARHLAEKGLAPPRPSAVGLEWDQVDRLVSPSVLMVLRAPR